ncbi:MAG: GntR family transcriptional regulator [Pseudomonadota bacterium]
MLDLVENLQRRTTTDVVFEQLHEEIASLTILPGAKLSESDIAQRFGVSRQPVRDAFNRLENLDLLLIRPQRATEVRGFSMKRIAHARFIRLAVELEVIRQACSVWDSTCVDTLEQNLQLQRQSLAGGQSDQFHQLDYQFHKLICELGGCPMAFETIEECKNKVDRLCVLSLDRKDESATLFDDHEQLAEALKNGAVEDATRVARQHFARLDDIIADVHKKHSEYFE